MWFPYSLPVRWKAESERHRIDESLADPDRREFLVGFILQSRIGNEWGVEVRLDEPRWLTQAEDGEAFSTGFYPNESGRLAEIFCRMEESSPAGALRRAHAHVARTLDRWSAARGRGFAILGFRIADLKHDARWRSLPHRPSDEDFDAIIEAELPDAYGHVMALYRQARNSSSDVYRLLCCCKILRLWTEGKEPFELARASGERDERLVVTREMLALSGMLEFRPDLDGTPFGRLLDRLEPWPDRALATVTDEGGPVDFADYEQGRELAAVANLTDLAVHRIFAAAITSVQGVAEPCEA